MNKFCVILSAIAVTITIARGENIMTVLDYAGIEEALAVGDPFNGHDIGGRAAQTLKEFVISPGESLSASSHVQFCQTPMMAFH